MPRLIVIADDFTGANDTGVQLAKRGATVAVALSKMPVKCDIPVINTESRSKTTEFSIEAVQKAIIENIDKDTKVVFKKIDSTFRGNIGAEIEAAVSAFKAEIIIVAGAIPAAGRTTVNGKCLINGVPVTETEFARDPKTPVKSSQIAEIIGSQSTLPCRDVSLDQIRSGQLTIEIESANKASTPLVLIADAETENDLVIIAEAIEHANKKTVLVGAAGIAAQLPHSLFLSSRTLPVLVLAGSMSVVTQEQVYYCQQSGLYIVDIDVQEVYKHHNKILTYAIEHVSQVIRAGKNCAVRTTSNQNERHRTKVFCAEQEINGTELGDIVASFLGKLGKSLIERYPLSGVLLTGGDIATAVATEIGANGYVIEGEILPCIPYGHFSNHSTKIVTKAGGFGSVDAIEKIIEYLQEIE
ncbi:TPA: four-carbon acid sugar kinase family protein [Photobacterium damselae]